jgi:uncharacterized protein (TIGR00299 family) protein
MNVSEQVKEDVLNIYEMIALAESKAHGKKVEEIHFHEVGMMDAIADITGCCMLIRQLNADKIVVSPIVTGFGHVHCAHGIVPVPAPATAYLLEGIPNKAGNVEGELCTPTGAAIIKYFADEYGTRPTMITEKTGYGMGTKDFPVANCVRTFLGETKEKENKVCELCCNLDDMTPEQLAYAKEVIMEQGALDVYTTAIGMKKGREGFLLSVLCKPEQKEKMAGLIFKHTTTIGVREYECERMTLKRVIDEADTKYGKVHLKKSSGYGTQKVKIEYEDLKRIANETGKSITNINEELIKEIE